MLSDLGDNDNDDEILNRCYFWSFLFQNSNENDFDYNTDENDTIGDDVVVSPRQQECPRTSTTTATFLPLLISTIILIVVWCLGIHSMIQIQNTLSTDFVSLFETSNRENHVDKNSSIHSSLESISSYSSTLPIIIILGSDTGRNAWTTERTDRKSVV